MKLFHSIILLLIFSSCETIVDIEVSREAPKLVLHVNMNSDDFLHYLNIRESQFVLDDSEYKTVNNAIVSFFEEGIFKENVEMIKDGEGRDANNGVYLLRHNLKVNKTYTITAEAPGFAPVEATVSIPKQVPIKAIAVDTIYVKSGGFCFNGPCPKSERYRINLTFQDPASAYNYYSVAAFVKEYNRSNGILSSHDNSLYLYSEDVSLALSDFSIEGYGIQDEELWFSDEIFDGQTYTFSFEVEAGNYHVEDSLKLFVELRHQSEENFKYRVSRELQHWNDGNPFAEPVHVFSNVENGHGIFGSYNETVEEIIP